MGRGSGSRGGITLWWWGAKKRGGGGRGKGPVCKGVGGGGCDKIKKRFAPPVPIHWDGLVVKRKAEHKILTLVVAAETCQSIGREIQTPWNAGGGIRRLNEATCLIESQKKKASIKLLFTPSPKNIMLNLLKRVRPHTVICRHSYSTIDVRTANPANYKCSLFELQEGQLDMPPPPIDISVSFAPRLTSTHPPFPSLLHPPTPNPTPPPAP